MAKKSDEALIAILTVRMDDYSEEAIAAAQAELDKRGISKERIAMIEEAEVAVKANEIVTANEPLESDVKVLSMLFPFITWLIYADKFRLGGYDRKLAEMSAAYRLGRFIFFGLIVLFIILFKIIS